MRISDWTVTVHKPATKSDDAPMDTYPADEIVVREGHLNVQLGTRIVAIYAPGQWVSASVDTA
jgi:hypothetical protein